MGGGGKGGGGSSGPSYEQQQADYSAALEKQTTAYTQTLRDQQAEFSKKLEDTTAQNEVDYAAKLAEQQQAAELSSAKDQISSLYGSKLNAADAATTEVNTQIADEMAHAKLNGLDYSVDSLAKQNRINDVFATKWQEGDDTTLTGLTAKYGDQGFKWELPVVRGNPDTAITGLFTPGDSAGDKVAKGNKKKGAPAAVETDPLGSAAILG